MTTHGSMFLGRVWVFLGGLLLFVSILSPTIQAQSFSIRTFPVAGNSDDVLAVDLNHDFFLDLILLDRSNRVISVYLNQQDGAFSPPIISSVPDIPVSIDAVDVNEDGHLDLIAGLSSHSSFVVYIGNGNGTFLSPRPYDVAGWPVSLSVIGNRGFPTETGLTEVLSVSIDRISIAYGRPQDTTFHGGDAIYQLSGSGHLTHGAFADFNNDQARDILFALCCGTGSVPHATLYLMTGPPGAVSPFSSPQKIAELNQVQSLVAGDIRQDGNTGFIATFSGCAQSGCQGVMLFTGLGNGNFRQARLEVPASVFDIPRSPQLIDYNADGLNDVAVAVHRRVTSDGSAPHDSVLVWTANRDGTYRPFVEIKLSTDGLGEASNANSLRVVDLNADGRLDLVVANPRGNSITALTNQTQPAPQCLPRTDGPSLVTCTPVDGALVDATDLKINGSADSTQPITSGNVYIDGVLKSRFGGTIFEQSSLVPPGKHVVVVRAWDSTGRFFQTVRRLTQFNHYLAICPPEASESVNFCVPARDGPVSSPVRVLATGSSKDFVTGTNIYVDNVLMSRGGMFVDIRLSLSTGPHRIVAKSWNRGGISFFTVRNVMVNAQGCPLGPLLTVNVCSPTSGTTVSSPVHIEAMANSDQTITGWRIYSNNVRIYASSSQKLSTDLVLPKGDVTMLIKAWDSWGRIVGSVTRSVHVQ